MQDDGGILCHNLKLKLSLMAVSHGTCVFLLYLLLFVWLNIHGNVTFYFEQIKNILGRLEFHDLFNDKASECKFYLAIR